MMVFCAGCASSDGKVEETSRESMETSAESTSKPTSTPKPTKKTEKQTESISAQSSEETTAAEAERDAAEKMSARRSEVIAYEKQKNGYSSTEQGERYLDEPCGYCGVTDVYIDKYGACAICYDEYIQPEFGWCEVCGAPLNPAQSAFKRCWSCMKCQYCGIDMSSYINYDTGGVDSADGTWTCWDCYYQNNPPLCVICGINPQFDLSIGTCLECYEKENGSYYKNCAICGIQITPHNSALLNDQWVCFDCYDANS